MTKAKWNTIYLILMTVVIVISAAMLFVNTMAAVVISTVGLGTLLGIMAAKHFNIEQ